MNSQCERCRLNFERDQGFYLGSIYVNYGVTALVVVALYFILYFSGWLSPRASLWACAAFTVLFPLWFFRYARSLWLAFDECFDPTDDAGE